VPQVQQVQASFEGKKIILCLQFKYCLGLLADGNNMPLSFLSFDNLAMLTAMRGAGSRVSRLAAERRPGSCSYRLAAELSGMPYRNRQTQKNLNGLRAIVATR
jgi:hypothetical protein